MVGGTCDAPKQLMPFNLHQEIFYYFWIDIFFTFQSSVLIFPIFQHWKLETWCFSAASKFFQLFTRFKSERNYLSWWAWKIYTKTSRTIFDMKTSVFRMIKKYSYVVRQIRLWSWVFLAFAFFGTLLWAEREWKVKKYENETRTRTSWFETSSCSCDMMGYAKLVEKKGKP